MLTVLTCRLVSVVLAAALNLLLYLTCLTSRSAKRQHCQQSEQSSSFNLGKISLVSLQMLFDIGSEMIRARLLCFNMLQE